jgi:deazaflavin-dependent oxidoreductase (nitroreductase family)
MSVTSSILRVLGNMTISVYRLTDGRLPRKGLLILTTTGCKSKLKRTVLLGHFRDGDDYVITTYNIGRPKKPSWWFNLNADPRAVIEVCGNQIDVTAEQATPEQKERFMTKVLPRYRWYVDMMVLHPQKSAM